MLTQRKRVHTPCKKPSAKKSSPLVSTLKVYIPKELAPLIIEWTLKVLISRQWVAPQSLPFLDFEEKEGRVGHPDLSPIVLFSQLVYVW